jgi:hypothetical protein
VPAMPTETRAIGTPGPWPSVRGIVVCVNYDDLLSITLPRNLRHLRECLVVTSPDDVRTQELVRTTPGARLHVTDAFSRHGATFNKGLALEEGFDVLGREGWILIWDADILLPDRLPLDRLKFGSLHGARRRMLEDPARWHPGFNWAEAKPAPDAGMIGFFQLFHAADPALENVRPWYEVTFAHAGGGDAYFIEHWRRRRATMTVFPLEVLHLGPKDSNWFGRATPRLDGGEPVTSRDTMDAFVVRNGWHRHHRNIDRTAAERVGEIVERVQVPGYEPTQYELPFVKRHRMRRRVREAELRAAENGRRPSLRDAQQAQADDQGHQG